MDTVRSMFKVWDRVVDDDYGEGVVIAITDDETYPVRVAFNKEEDGHNIVDDFTGDGRWKADAPITLYRKMETTINVHTDDFVNRIHMVLENGVSIETNGQVGHTTHPLYFAVTVDGVVYNTEISDWETPKMMKFITCLSKLTKVQTHDAFILSDHDIEEDIFQCFVKVKKGEVFDAGVPYAEEVRDQVCDALNIPSFIRHCIDWTDLYYKMKEDNLVLNPNTGKIECGQYIDYGGGVLVVLYKED